jgi:hypothetical protein
MRTCLLNFQIFFYLVLLNLPCDAKENDIVRSCRIIFLERPLDASIDPESRVISKAPLLASGFYKAVFQYQKNGEGEPLPVMRKSWWYDAESKNLGIIINSKGILPKIYTLRDKFIHFRIVMRIHCKFSTC